ALLYVGPQRLRDRHRSARPAHRARSLGAAQLPGEPPHAGRLVLYDHRERRYVLAPTEKRRLYRLRALQRASEARRAVAKGTAGSDIPRRRAARGGIARRPNYRLNDALGVKRIGTVDHAESAILASGSALGLDGSISLIPGDRINRIRRITAQRLATYQLSGPSHSGKFDCRCEDPDDDRDDEDCGRTPDAFIDAITLNAYG